MSLPQQSGTLREVVLYTSSKAKRGFITVVLEVLRYEPIKVTVR